ncbi:hypothetical protein E1286_38740 [Nonomuraea terrae]|uniref:Uncharacterized protein n=1 Tax=Nonomuraea terrae TaxID=2530383 RepID=A0A4V6PDJ1_9ACTN|nr:hypothetical protein [Nonomuraea terrae]TDD36107.1 hypothetical protein E1286_38740 [Nonomuraea terrae]
MSADMEDSQEFVFWGPGGYVENAVDPADRVVVDGEHYAIGGDTGGFRGHGGRRFDIEWFDGRTATTRNLWHQGTVPAEWRHRYPDNARFVHHHRRYQVMTSPRDTSKTDALLLLADAMGSGGMEGAILRMEADGQREFVNSEVIPTKITGGSEADLTALGFHLGEQVEGDPLFRRVTLPDGWKREAADHSMWSYIIDGLGRRRVSVFYKAAFYDRRAGLSINTVYSYVGQCLDEKVRPIFDDVWATQDAVRGAVVAQLAERADFLAMYEHREDEYGRERAAELKAEIAACQALYAEVTGGAA